MTAATALRASATAKLWAAARNGEFLGAYLTQREARSAAGRTGTVYRPDGSPVAPRKPAAPVGLAWRRRRPHPSWAAEYESTDGRWKIAPIAYTIPCDGYVDGHIGCLGNTEHMHEAWELSQMVDGRWVADEEFYPRLRDAKAVVARVTTR